MFYQKIACKTFLFIIYWWKSHFLCICCCLGTPLSVHCLILCHIDFIILTVSETLHNIYGYGQTYSQNLKYPHNMDHQLFVFL